MPELIPKIAPNLQQVWFKNFRTTQEFKLVLHMHHQITSQNNPIIMTVTKINQADNKKWHNFYWFNS